MSAQPGEQPLLVPLNDAGFGSQSTSNIITCYHSVAKVDVRIVHLHSRTVLADGPMRVQLQ
jgi:hypothetical protein